MVVRCSQIAVSTVLIFTAIVFVRCQQVTKDPLCGNKKGCYSDCLEASCSFVVSWSVTGNIAEYTLSSVVPLNSAVWIAIGFSADKLMNDDDIMVCAADTSRTAYFFGKNTQHGQPNKYPDSEIIWKSITYVNGVLTCTIQRPVQGSTATGRFDVRSPWTLLFAHGPTTFDSSNVPTISHHSARFPSVAPAKANNPVDFGIANPTGITVSKPSECGKTKGCFSDCQGQSCGFVVSWTQNGTFATYTLTSTVAKNTGTWIAVGFSVDIHMGDDDVMGCVHDYNGTVLAFSAKNPIYNTPIPYTDPEIILTSSTVLDGVLSCTFQRPVNASASTGRSDVNSGWTLLFAKGLGTIDTNGKEMIHKHSDKFVSPSTARVSEFSDISLAAPPQTATSSAPPQTNLVKPDGCTTTMGCFSDCQAQKCSFFVSWSQSGTNATYTLSATSTSGSGFWVAVGFSNDTLMGGDDVLGCASDATGKIISFGAQNPKHAKPTTFTDSEVILTKGSVTNGVLTCTLQRPVAGVSNGRVDVSKPWTLLFAKGRATISSAGQADIEYHETKRYWSTSQAKINDHIDIGVEDKPVTPPSQTAGTVPKEAGCGTNKGCFSDCQGSTCSYMISWSQNGNNSIYTLAANVPKNTNSWFALGFSKDKYMGEDDVMICTVTSSGQVRGFSAHNTVKERPTNYSDPDIKLITSQAKDDILSCTFQRPVAGSDTGRVDVNEEWILLFAQGDWPSSSDEKILINKHPGIPRISSAPVKVSQLVDMGAQSVDYPLVKAHGSLMIGAWIFLASIGIVLARYYKPVWKGLMCSEKVWFQLHRACMIFVFCATAAGFIIIFIEVDGYSDIQESRTFLVGHPIIGIIVMILTVLNPIMALFRCHPGTPKRPIFNWGHWFVGTSAHILAVVNIFFGVLLTKSNVPYYLMYIIGAYVAWQIFVELLLELISCFGKKIDRSEAYELSSEEVRKMVTTEESTGVLIAKRIILVIHCLIVATFAAVLIGLLAVGKEELED